MNNTTNNAAKSSNKNLAVIFLSEGGYKLSSYYGKILSSMTFLSLAAAKNACKDAGMDFIVA